MNELLTTLIQEVRVWPGHRHHRARIPAEATGYRELDEPLGGGWPRGALTECLLDGVGMGELQLVLPAMRRLSRRGKRVFWINPPHIPYAPALDQEDVDLNQVLVIRTNNRGDTLWTLENCLRAPVTGLVLAWPGGLASREIRRLQLAAEAGRSVCILFRDRRQASQNSPAALRLQLTPDGYLGLNIQVLKRRGGRPGQSCTLNTARRAGLAQTEASGVVQGPWTVPRE